MPASDPLLSTPIVASLEQIVAEAAAGGSTAGRLIGEFVEKLDALSEGIAAPAGNRVLPIVWGEQVLFIVQSDTPAELIVEDSPTVAMTQLSGSELWTHVTRLPAGGTYNFSVWAGGKPLGAGISPHCVAVHHPYSYPLADAPTGEISDRREITSEVYDGSVAEYWIYRNPGIDTQRGAPVMIWLDGRGYLGAADAISGRIQTVTDNLVHLGRIPPMVHVLLTAGSPGRNDPPPEAFHTGVYDSRIMQFDEVSDRFGRYLIEELLPAVGQEVKLRSDGYSRAIFGGSSGGTCAFKVGWFAPQEFSRLHPYIASFTAWGWRPGDGVEGGQVLPLWVRREPRKNLRIWLSAGVYDEFDFEHPAHLQYAQDALESLQPALHRAGSQSLGNFEMAQALKTSGYDFHFRFGNSGHNFAQAGLDFPESLTWLWRDYDAELESQVYEQDAEERAKPAYQFAVTNRDVW